mmetsp:Transcript_17995/g.36533  ORF Transcript_17995/g.36533 Transcript_17995/m.36533 type:complete len:87 (-) Transcript_17995:265-525(-)
MHACGTFLPSSFITACSHLLIMPACLPSFPAGCLPVWREQSRDPTRKREKKKKKKKKKRRKPSHAANVRIPTAEKSDGSGRGKGQA